MASNTDELAELNRQLQAAETVDRPAVEEQIREVERNKQSFESGWAWIVSPDALSNWKNYCADLQIVGYNGIFNNPDSIAPIRNLILQFNANTITAEEFAKKLDNMFYLQQKEGTWE